jgi:hypothetical protein
MPERITELLYKNGLVPLADFQQLMGWTESTLIARRARGEIPPIYKKGMVLTLKEAELVEWLTNEEPIDRITQAKRANAADQDATDALLK